MNLWGHSFFQNANQKLSRFLSYQIFFWWFFGECRQSFCLWSLFVWQGRNLEKFWLAFWVKRSSKIHSEFNWPIVQFAKPRKIGKHTHTHCLLASPGGVKHGSIFWSKFSRKRSSFNILLKMHSLKFTYYQKQWFVFLPFKKKKKKKSDARYNVGFKFCYYILKILIKKLHLYIQIFESMVVNWMLE